MSEPNAHIYWSLRMESAEIKKLLDAMDAENAKDPKAMRRQHERYVYRNENCVLHMKQPGSSVPTSYFCPTRNLSSGGICFLHGGFVHMGSEVRIQLISHHGNWQDVIGTVVGCRLVSAPVHEIRVKFTEPIDPGLFCEDAASRHKRVLFISDDVSAQRLVQIILKQHGCLVDCVGDQDSALAKLSVGSFGIVICTIGSPDLTELNMIKSMRQEGYRDLVVAVAEDISADDREQCLVAGVNYFLSNVTDKEEFARILDIAAKGPMQSQLKLADLVASFVDSLPSVIRTIEKAVKEGPIETLAGTVRKLKNDANQYRYDRISEVAEKLEQAVHQQNEMDALKPVISELVTMCLQARAPIASK
jgi:CheY-like chemotaxis protein